MDVQEEQIVETYEEPVQDATPTPMAPPSLAERLVELEARVLGIELREKTFRDKVLRKINAVPVEVELTAPTIKRFGHGGLAYGKAQR